MTWVGLVLLLVGAYLAYRLVGALLKVLMFVLALVGAYWLLAPHLGWPSVSDLFYVLGPDFGGRRIEEVIAPSNLASEAAGRVTDQVVDGVIDRILPPSPEPPSEPLPEPVPEVEPLSEPASAVSSEGSPQVDGETPVP